MTLAELRATDRHRLRRIARRNPEWSPLRIAAAFASDVDEYGQRVLLTAAGEIAGVEWHDGTEGDPEVGEPSSGAAGPCLGCDEEAAVGEADQATTEYAGEMEGAQ